MAVESSFNPFAQSPVGAQGLMQVMTKVHDDKYEAFGGRHAAFDPVTNLRVGVQVLKECIARAGSLEAGLRYYVGAANIDDGGYVMKVLVEQNILRQLAGQKPLPLPARRPAAVAEAADRDAPAAPAADADRPPGGRSGDPAGEDRPASLGLLGGRGPLHFQRCATGDSAPLSGLRWGTTGERGRSLRDATAGRAVRLGHPLASSRARTPAAGADRCFTAVLPSSPTPTRRSPRSSSARTSARKSTSS